MQSLFGNTKKEMSKTGLLDLRLVSVNKLEHNVCDS